MFKHILLYYLLREEVEDKFMRNERWVNWEENDADWIERKNTNISSLKLFVFELICQ